MRLAAAILERAARGEPRVARGYSDEEADGAGAWSADDDAQLLRLRKQQLLSYKVISRIMGRTERCCAVRVHRLTAKNKAH